MLKLQSLLIAALITAAPFTGTAQEATAINKTSQDFISVAKTAIPAVVSIQVQSKAKPPGGNGYYEYDPQYDSFNDDFFGRFFGVPKRDKAPSEMEIAQASGFLVSPDGYILTNNHVVRTHGTITVKLNDGREFPGKIIGEDESTDVALIKIDAKDLPYLKLGNSDDLNVGQWVVAIGNPLGLQASLTVGVVSAKGRSNLDIARIEDFIQTDAAINRGNSGGPLLNLSAEVVGINTAIATEMGSSGYMGIGFAIPSTMAKHVMEQLISSGSVKRGYLGIVMQPIDNDLAQVFDLKKVEGALIADVVRGSPADKAGLKQGDIILKYNDIPVDSMGSLRNFVALQKPGDKVNLNIMRDKKPMSITVEIGTFQGNAPEAEVEEPISNQLGLDVQTMTSDLAKNLNIGDQSGVIIIKVDPNGTAALTGLKKGMMILAVNNQKVASKQEFDQAIKTTPKGKPVLLLVKQGSNTRYVSIRLNN